MTARNRIAGILCILGGVLLVVAGTTGMKPLLEEILKYIQPTVDASPILATIFRVEQRKANAPSRCFLMHPRQSFTMSLGFFMQAHSTVSNS